MRKIMAEYGKLVLGFFVNLCNKVPKKEVLQV